MSQERMPASVPFYDRDQFEIVKSMLEGTGIDLSYSYEQWLSALDSAEEEARRRGGIPVRIKIIASEAEAWIKSEKLEFNRNSLNLYAAHKLSEQLGDRRLN